MTEAYAIKPCPCCGRDARFEEVPEGQQNSGGIYIECTNKLCRLSTNLMFPLMDDVRPELAQKWNRRVPVTVSEKKRCEVCSGQGWTTQPDPRNGDATQVQCEPCFGTGAVSEKGEAEALLKEAREDLFRLGGDSAMAYEHGDSVSRKEANDEASAIHARIDAYLSRGQG